jgi:hypothetical protein
MIQVKIIRTKAQNSSEKIEEKVNQFLLENKDLIKVVDIKYTAETLNPNNDIWTKWTILIIYEKL